MDIDRDKRSASQAPLLSTGIDIECIDRFADLEQDPGHPMPFVFTEQEIAHARGLADPRQGLCASFCCKEALFKALGEPYEFTDCELLWHTDRQSASPTLSPELMARYRIDQVHAKIQPNPLDHRELVVAVVLLRSGS